MAKSVHHRKSNARSSKVRKTPRKTKKVVRRKRKSTSSKRKKRKSSKKRKNRSKKVMKGGGGEGEKEVIDEIKNTDNKTEILSKIEISKETNNPSIISSSFYQNQLCFTDDEIIKALWDAGQTVILSTVDKLKAEMLISSFNLIKDTDYTIIEDEDVMIGNNPYAPKQ